jgi:hypothetical protein
VSLLSNSIAGITPEQIYGDQLLVVAKYVNSEKWTFQRTIESFSKVDSKKSEEIKSYLVKNPSFEKTFLPALTVESNSLILTIDGQKVSYRVFPNGDILILYGNKKIKAEFSMPFDQMIVKVSAQLGLDNRFSLINLLVSDANANPGLILAVILLALPVIALAGILMAGKAGGPLVEFGEKICRDNKDTRDGMFDQNNLNNIKFAYNKISDAYMAHCLASKNFDEKTCQKFPAVKTCIGDIIKRGDKALGNNTSLNGIKEADHFPEIRDQSEHKNGALGK